MLSPLKTFPRLSAQCTSLARPGREIEWWWLVNGSVECWRAFSSGAAHPKVLSWGFYEVLSGKPNTVTSLPQWKVLNCGFVFLGSVKCGVFLMSVVGWAEHHSCWVYATAFKLLFISAIFNAEPQCSAETASLRQRFWGAGLRGIRGMQVPGASGARYPERKEMFLYTFLSPPGPAVFLSGNMRGTLVLSLTHTK